MKRHYITAGSPGDSFGWDLDDGDRARFGAFVGKHAATARFSTPADAEEADRLVSFIMDMLDGCVLHLSSSGSWEPGERPAWMPQAATLAEAFKELDAEERGEMRDCATVKPGDAEEGGAE